MTTYTKTIIAKNKNHIIKMSGGKKAFYQNALTWQKNMTAGRRGYRPKASKVVYEMAINGEFLPYVSDMYAYLSRTIPDFDPSIYHYANGELKTDKVESVYCKLIARDGAKILSDMDLDLFLNGRTTNFW